MKVFSLIFLLFFAVLMACDGPEGPAGLSSLVDISDEPPGNNCTNGGTKIMTGLDRNENGTLEASEAKTTRFVCNGLGPKEIRIDFVNGGSTNAGTPGTETDSTHPQTIKVYDDFNIDVYPGYDSVVYIVRNVAVYQLNNAQPVTGRNLTIELVDMATGNAIGTSTMSVPTGAKFVSNNLFQSIPSGPIDLGIRMSSSDPNYSGGAYPISLVLIDKN